MIPIVLYVATGMTVVTYPAFRRAFREYADGLGSEIAMAIFYVLFGGTMWIIATIAVAYVVTF